jgi:hypothetical protein
MKSKTTRLAPPVTPVKAQHEYARRDSTIKSTDRAPLLESGRRAAYQNARANTPHTARMAHDKAMLDVLKDDTEIYKQFVQNPSFKRFVTDMVFGFVGEAP